MWGRYSRSVCPLTCCLPALSLEIFSVSSLLCTPLDLHLSEQVFLLSLCDLDPAAQVCVLLFSSCNHPFCLPGVELACFVIVTMEKQPSACMPHLPFLLLLSVTLIRMVEDLGQRLLLPLKRTEKTPPTTTTTTPSLSFPPSFLSFSQSIPPPYNSSVRNVS